MSVNHPQPFADFLAMLTPKGYKPFKLRTEKKKALKRAYKLSEKNALTVPESYCGFLAIKFSLACLQFLA